MKQINMVTVVAFFALVLVSHSVVGSSSAEVLTPAQKKAVDQAVEQYLEKKGIPQGNPRPIDFSQIVSWKGERQPPAAFDSQGEKFPAFGLIKVRATGSYSRGYQTQLRFFHLLNLETEKRIRVNVQSADKAFILALPPGRYEVVRVQITEGPFTMESHTQLKFHVRPNGINYLGTWQFEVDSPRTQRMVRLEVLSEPSTRDLVLDKNTELRTQPLLVSLPQPTTDEFRLFGVAPAQSRSKYFNRR